VRAQLVAEAADAAQATALGEAAARLLQG
jgi:hypothetical protein